MQGRSPGGLPLGLRAETRSLRTENVQKDSRGNCVKKAILVIVSVLVIMISGAAYVMRDLIFMYLPETKEADLQQVLQVSGEETAVFYQDRLESVTGITRDGQVYLPIEWVNRVLNEKFYWDDEEKLLVYTLPETIVYADKRTVGSTGLPLLLAENDTIYLSLSLIAGYTPLESLSYLQGEGKRVYLDDRFADHPAALAAGRAAVRVRGGIKSQILTRLEKGDRVYILEELEEWSKVRTGDGLIGYVRKKALRDHYTEPAAQKPEEPVYRSLSLGEPVCLVFHQVTESTENGRIGQLLAGTEGINVVVPTWFSLTDSEGAYDSFADASYVAKLHEKGIQVWASLENVNHTKSVNNTRLFSRTSVRQKLISSLIADAETYDLDGINLDIESLTQTAGGHYVEFIRELSTACRKAGLILSIDNYVPASYNAFYNRREQGRVADYLIIMGYDEHYSGSDPGSVASYPFVRAGIEDTLAEVPKEKVINAFPFYTRIWTVKDGKTSSRAVSMKKAAEWISGNKVSLEWLDEEQQYYGELTEKGSRQMIWLEDLQSLRAKLELIREYDIAGAAFWKLGLEDEGVWSLIQGE